MASAFGFWMTNGLFSSPLPLTGSSAQGANKFKPQRNHHYTFDVGDNGLDINGFILQAYKHKGKRRKIRVYLDSNENGRFDKNDPLIGRTGLKHKHAAKGVGNLLDEDEIGQLAIRFKKDTSNALISSVGQDDSERNPRISSSDDPELVKESGIAASDPTLQFQRLSFADSDGSQIVSVTPQLGAEAAWGQLH